VAYTAVLEMGILERVSLVQIQPPPPNPLTLWSPVGE
jgi:hypothetical protein